MTKREMSGASSPEMTPPGVERARKRTLVAQEQLSAPTREGTDGHQEDVRESEKKIGALRKRLSSEPRWQKTTKDISPRERRQKIEAYQQKYLPDHLKGKEGKPAPFSWALRAFMWAKEKLGRTHVEGREHISDAGGQLVLANHSGGESGKLFGVFGKRPLRIAAGEDIHWNHSPLKRWLLKKLGMIPVRESLSNLSKTEKDALIARLPEKAKAGYQRVLDREQSETSALADAASRLAFARAAVAALSRGDSVALFPEGLFTYTGDTTMRKAYGGIDYIAKEFEKLTGRPLPLLPIGISKNGVRIGKSFDFSEKKKNGTTETDWAMRHVAELLPEEQRGYYRE